MKLSTLMYHDVIRGPTDASGRSTPGAHRYKLDWPTFLEHLDRFADHATGAPVLAEDVIRGTVPDAAWALTFDDGGASGVEIADELYRRGWRAHFLVTTGRIGTTGFLDPEGIRTIASQGHIIGTHSVSHPNLRLLPWAAMVDEWRASAAVLSDLLDGPVTTGSVPGGWYSGQVGRAAAAAGLRLLFTSEPVRTITQVDGCLIAGRHALRRNESTARAAALAGGSPVAWGRGRVAWRARAVTKELAGTTYESIRTAWLGRR
jgi:peptidoglycan/xylan/chitin deacetylase (PgdA/CDA1 family)